MNPLSILQGIERRAHARPCTRGDLLSLETELETCIRTFREHREALREQALIDPEPKDVRQAVYAARIAIKHAFAEHSTAEIEMRRIQELVRCGRVHQAAIERTQIPNTAKFSDLNLDFVEAASAQQAERGQKWVTIAIVAAILVLIIVTVIELMKRSQAP